MPYTMADFRRDYAKEHFKDLTPEERREAVQGLPPKEQNEILQGLLEQRLAGASQEEIEKYVKELERKSATSRRESHSRSSRRGRKK